MGKYSTYIQFIYRRCTSSMGRLPYKKSDRFVSFDVCSVKGAGIFQITIKGKCGPVRYLILRYQYVQNRHKCPVNFKTPPQYISSFSYKQKLNFKTIRLDAVLFSIFILKTVDRDLDDTEQSCTE